MLRGLKRVPMYGLGGFFVVAGINHFVNPRVYMQIMPPYLPQPLFLVYLSGLLEVAAGAALLVPRTRRWGAWGIIAVLIGIFPANVHMALNSGLYPGIPPAALWARMRWGGREMLRRQNKIISLIPPSPS